MNSTKRGRVENDDDEIQEIEEEPVRQASNEFGNFDVNMDLLNMQLTIVNISMHLFTNPYLLIWYLMQIGVLAKEKKMS
jgi:hypothetical protein